MLNISNFFNLVQSNEIKIYFILFKLIYYFNFNDLIRLDSHRSLDDISFLLIISVYNY